VPLQDSQRQKTISLLFFTGLVSLLSEHPSYLMLFHGNSGLANASQCYIHTYTACLVLCIKEGAASSSSYWYYNSENAANKSATVVLDTESVSSHKIVGKICYKRSSVSRLLKRRQQKIYFEKPRIMNRISAHGQDSIVKSFCLFDRQTS
jgi:hypothetical protein